MTQDAPRCIYTGFVLTYFLARQLQTCALILTVDRCISIAKPLQYLTFATKLESCPCNNSSLVFANPYRPFTFVNLYTFAAGD